MAGGVSWREWIGNTRASQFSGVAKGYMAASLREIVQV